MASPRLDNLLDVGKGTEGSVTKLENRRKEDGPGVKDKESRFGHTEINAVRHVVYSSEERSKAETEVGTLGTEIPAEAWSVCVAEARRLSSKEGRATTGTPTFQGWHRKRSLRRGLRETQSPGDLE